MSEVKTYRIEEIMNMLPHRYPFLLVDRLEVRGSGRKRRRHQERNDERRVFPGTFSRKSGLCPAFCRLRPWLRRAGAIVSCAKEDYAEHKAGVLFMSIDGVKFRKPVKPGDQLRMHVEKIKARRNVYVFRGEAKVDGQVVSEAEFTAMIME